MTPGVTSGRHAADIEIDFRSMQDVMYWAKKWEVSPRRVIEVHHTLNTSYVKKIENYLRAKGYAI